MSLAVFSVMIALTGLFAAWRLYKVDPQIPDDLVRSQPELHKLLIDKYRVDEAYDATVVQPLLRVSEKTFYRFLDRRVIDRSIDRLSSFVAWVGTKLALGQSGMVRTYIAVMIGGLLLIMLSLLA
jgi:NADH-quinone oxidoreductase subunit L